jgi:heavy metal sensor kinase
VSLPIRARMTLWYVALLAAIIAAVGAFLVVRLRADLTAELDRRLNPALDQIALGYHEEGAPELPDISGTVLSGESAASQVLATDGTVAAHYGARVAGAPMLRPAELHAVLADGVRIDRSATLGAHRWRVVARASTRKGAPVAVVAAESTAPIDRSVHRLIVLLLIAGPAALAATAAGGWWLARRSLRPIQRLTDEAALIGIDRLADRLPEPATHDEVARLAATLNTMLARIEAGVEEQHRLIADASHELRSPLAAMRAELDVSLRADHLDPQAAAVLRSARAEVDRLSRTVDGLLTLAQADQGALDLELGPVDLATVAEETAHRLQSLAADRSIDLRTSLDPAPVRGDPGRLAQAVANLLDNAIKYSPAGGAVVVSTATDGAHARLDVLDEGPGIPPDARERVFDRFARLDASRTQATGGAGIGLSLVQEIARAHGGRASTEPGPRGGSRFSLVLPSSAGTPARRTGPTDRDPRFPVSGMGV